LNAVTRTVLIAEDDEFLLQLLRMVFESEGFAAVAARDGKEAIDIARRVRPDAVLLDVCMPNLDGWSVLQSLRADEGTARVPVVMMSALREHLPSKDAGPRADAFVAKPFSLRDVVRMVRLCTDVPRRPRSEPQIA
jgi:DNA-binding response OmpR family regulator